ncbi:MAG: hypothetical protein E6J75_12315, partial [Deltaproteobacteria bacterium]
MNASRTDTNEPRTASVLGAGYGAHVSGTPLSRRSFLAGVGAIGVAARLGHRSIDRWSGRRPVFDVRDFGATGNGVTVDTRAVQWALDEAGERGATVRLGPGTYRCGTLRLRSGIRLVLEARATLLATDRSADFLPLERLLYPTGADFETSDFQHALLTGERLDHVAIVGEGTIDGGRTQRGGPKPLALRRCRDVAVRGITIRNAPNYCISLGGCDDVVIEDVTIRDAFADGIDPDCCCRVRIIGCDVESDDDAIVLKASRILGVVRATEDVIVERCRMMSPSNGFKIGTETQGPVRRVRVRDCRINGRARPGAHLHATGGVPFTTSAEGGGVAVESFDGGAVEHVLIERTCVTDALVPIFVRLGGPRPGTLSNITVRALTATGAQDACTISGLPGHPVERLTIDDVHLATSARTAPPPGPLPELPVAYPKAGMFGPLPASGMWIRHAR